jgi:predicted amidohydrolase
VVAALPWGRIGLSICYDIRFGQLYRTLAKAGAEILTVPSAFTVPTGEAHWHVLNRARAIENGCFLMSPAQGGTHPNGRKTYGHSLIVDPWGRIVAEGGTDPGVIVADLDLEEIGKVRSRIPALRHDRPFRTP